MVAKYKTLYFNAKEDLEYNKITIWSYKKPSWLNGFSISVDDDCIQCWCKDVDVTELEKLMVVGFSVLWNGAEYKCEYIPAKNSIKLFTENIQLAHELGFKPKDNIIFEKLVPISEVSEFRVSKLDCFKQKTKVDYVDEEMFVGLWRLYVSNLSYGKKKGKDLVSAFM